MSTKIIVSYDGTANEDDAIALGPHLRPRRRRGVGCLRASQRRARLQRRDPRPERSRGAAAARGRPAREPRRPPSTSSPTVPPPRACGRWPRPRAQTLIVFCSDSHTAKGHVAIGNSAERLLEGGATAVAIAPAGLGEAGAEATLQRIVAVGDANGGAQATAAGPGLGARSDRRAGCQPGRRPAGHRLSPGSRAGSRLDQLIGIASDRDRHLLGAGRAPRGDAVLRRDDRRSRRLAVPRAGVPAAAHGGRGTPRRAARARACASRWRASA